MASQFQNATCPACAKNFTQTSFQSHLCQTKDPHCAALYAHYLIVEPERHYADADQMIWVYSDMNTGKWWWCTQVSHILVFSNT